MDYIVRSNNFDAVYDFVIFGDLLVLFTKYGSVNVDLNKILINAS